MEKELTLSKNKNFILNILGSLVSNIGAVLYSFAVSFYILKITNNNSIIQGTYLAVVGIVSIVAMLAGGVIADRFNKAKIMYLCDYLKCGVLVLSTLLMFITNNVTFILIVLFVAGVVGNVISGIFTPASNALLPFIVKEEQLQKANSYFSLLQSAQAILGVVLAGVLYSTLSIYALFFIVAGCYFASAISEMFIKYNHTHNDSPLTLKSSINEIGDGFKYIFKNKALFYLIICILFVNFFFTPVDSNMLPYFVATEVSSCEYLFHEFMEPEMWNSIISVILAIGMIVGSIVVGFIRYKKSSTCARIGIATIFLLMLAITGCYYFMVDVNNQVNMFIIVLTILGFLIGFFIPIINVPIGTTIQKITSDDMRGKVSAAINIGSMGLTPLASLLAGIMIATTGTAILLLICSIGFAITTVAFVLNKEISKL